MRPHAVRIVDRLLEADDLGYLWFDSSAAAERYILREPILRRSSAFSWWSGQQGQWGIAVNPTGVPEFIRKVGEEFYSGENPLA